MSSDSETFSVDKIGSKEALRMCKETTDIDVIIELSKHKDPQVRQRALKEMCPCRVKRDLTDFWQRVFEMTGDEAVNVREQVLHTMADGAPAHLEFQVAEALEDFNRDPDPYIRRRAHKVLTAYRRTGKWNIL